MYKYPPTHSTHIIVPHDTDVSVLHVEHSPTEEPPGQDQGPGDPHPTGELLSGVEQLYLLHASGVCPATQLREQVQDCLGARLKAG